MKPGGVFRAGFASGYFYENLPYARMACCGLLFVGLISVAQASDEDILAELRALKNEVRQLQQLKDKVRKLESRLAEKQNAQRHAAQSGQLTQSGQLDAPPPGARPVVAPVGQVVGESEDASSKKPRHFTYKGVTITPGGFFALESVYRERNMTSDMATNYSNIPYPNYAPGHIDEFRFSARQSRLAMRVEGQANPSTRLTGYVELDFLGAAQTANSNQTNSYTPRVRHLYAAVDRSDLGLQFLGGQTWSMATLTSKGITPDTVLTPATIDAQYVPGFFFARQPGVRLVKTFGDSFSIGLSVESPATTYASRGSPYIGVNAFPEIGGGLSGQALTTTTPLGGGLFNSANQYSFNRLPEFIGKIAWDTSLADRPIHLEAFGMAREFESRVYWANRRQTGGGFGAGLVMALWPKYLDAQISGGLGNGIGRFGASGMPDAFTGLSGAPTPIHQRMLLAGLTAHVTSDTDVYGYAGGEFASRHAEFGRDGNSLLVGGYGNPLFDNRGCTIESSSSIAVVSDFSVCTGQTKAIRQVTGGFWHTFYEGDFGKLKGGLQYSYTVRNGFQGVGGAPRGRENILFSSFRYYPF